MHIVVLNGLTINPVVDGRIAPFFPGSIEVYRWNWRPKDVHWIMFKIFTEIGTEPYVLVGFSDGATMAHAVAKQDPRCKGLVVHSGLRASLDQVREIPTLLITTRGDRTGCRQATEDMYYMYGSMLKDSKLLQLVELPLSEPKSWYEHVFRHQFHNAVGLINDWISATFDEE